MDIDEFWSFIDRIDAQRLGDDVAAAIKPLEQALHGIAEAALVSFQSHLETVLDGLHTRAHARAAGESGESDDGFLYARAAVVARGRSFYERVRSNPRAMPRDGEWAEELLSVAAEVMLARSGRELPPIEPKRRLRPLQVVNFHARGEGYAVQMRLRHVHARLDHELARADASVAAPFVKLNLSFQVGGESRRTQVTGFVFEGIAHVETPCVLPPTIATAPATEFFASIERVYAEAKPFLEDQLHFRPARFEQIVTSLVTNGASCRERIPKWGKTLERGGRRLAFDWVLQPDCSRIVAVIEHPVGGERLGEWEVLSSDFPEDWRMMLYGKTLRVDAQARVVQVVNRDKTIERRVQFGG